MRRRGVLVLGLCLLAAACAPGDTNAARPTSAPATSAAAGTSAPQSDGASAGVPENLAFTADLVGGGQLEGGDLAGGDVVLWFWAPW